ncbi:hypothetical protein MTE1_5035 [Klebsiella pneumoniae JHCK1]|nr:hypothetical protein MTE1_5035 [Klebsiella pneumoniae JHCK1]
MDNNNQPLNGTKKHMKTVRNTGLVNFNFSD